MKLSTRIIEKVINVGMITILAFAAETVVCLAQTNNPAEHERLLKTAGKKILLTKNLNPEGKAVALPKLINSGYAERIPVISPDDSRIYFNRALHPLNTGAADDLGDVWYSDLDSVTEEWMKPELLQGSVNNKGANSINGIGEKGDTIILNSAYLKNGNVGPGISYSVKKEEKWSMPVPINIKKDQNVSSHRESFVALGIGVIITSVKRKDTFGDRDLYISFWNGKEASEPISMGPAINSAFDETTPYLSPDYKTLYFASKGHQGYGGFDIYVTRRLDTSWTNWSAPENLGPAINGELDEESFIISYSNAYAYFTRQITVHNADIYSIAVNELFLSKTHFR